VNKEHESQGRKGVRERVTEIKSESEARRRPTLASGRRTTVA
jgi:hypothetical protein